MNRFRTRQIILIGLTLIVIAIAIAALVSVARFLFFSGGTTSPQVSSSESALISTSADRSVKMTVRGPIVANENFRSYQIRVTPNDRSLTTYSGYLDQVLSNESIGNNIPAYEQFVYALNSAHLMNGTELAGDNNDTRGVCATGYLYKFQILKGSTSVKELWTTSCSASRGSLNASLSPLTKLFIAQIPNTDSVIGDLW